MKHAEFVPKLKKKMNARSTAIIFDTPDLKINIFDLENKMSATRLVFIITFNNHIFFRLKIFIIIRF